MFFIHARCLLSYHCDSVISLLKENFAPIITRENSPAGFMSMSPAKTTEPIEMPIRFWTPVDPRSHVLDGGSDPLWEREL